MDITDFTKDMTAEAEAGFLERPIGRDKELEFILRALNQEGKSNVLILGPAGSGKTVLAEGLAYMIKNNEVPENYPRKKVLEVNLTALNSGAIYVGQFEERVTHFIENVKNDPSVIVFIDEIHMLMGFGKAGDGGAARDLSQIIKPPLARGQICCLGATTKEEFDRYIASDAAFVRRFQILNLEPLDIDAVFQILKRATLKNKYTYGVEFSDDTISRLIEISEQYYINRFQPDKSLDVLKRLVIGLQIGSNIAKNSTERNLVDYIKILDQELSLVERGEFNLVQKQAKEWLGIFETQIKTIDLTKENIIQILGLKK